MRLESWVKALGWEVALLGASGVYTVAVFYEKLGLSPRLAEFGLIWCALLSLAIIFTIVVIMWKLVSQNVRVREFFRRDRGLYARSCADNDDLMFISKHGSSIFDNSTNEQETKRIFDLDNLSFTVVRDSSDRRRGYFCVIRLSSAGVRAIEEGVFSVRHLTSDQVGTKKKLYVPIYIGAICGELSGTGILNTNLIAKVEEYVRLHKPRKVYARAATKQGLYWLEEYKFMPVEAGKPGLGNFYFRTG